MTSNNIKTGGPAFPCDTIVNRDEKGHMHGNEVSSTGLTIRDHFAGLAMQGDWAEGEVNPCAYEARAAEYYAMADAMLKARSTKPA